MEAETVRRAIEEAKEEFQKSRMKGNVYEWGVADGLDLAMKAVDRLIAQERLAGGE